MSLLVSGSKRNDRREFGKIGPANLKLKNPIDRLLFSCGSVVEARVGLMEWTMWLSEYDLLMEWTMWLSEHDLFILARAHKSMPENVLRRLWCSCSVSFATVGSGELVIENDVHSMTKSSL